MITQDDKRDFDELLDTVWFGDKTLREITDRLIADDDLADEDDSDDDDEDETRPTPPDVVAMLGFDPGDDPELNSISKSILDDVPE